MDMDDMGRSIQYVLIVTVYVYDRSMTLSLSYVPVWLPTTDCTVLRRSITQNDT